FNRNEAFQASNFFATTKPKLRQNQFGTAIGGRLLADRLFTFGYIEGFRNTEGQTDTKPVLSAAQRAGDFSGSAILRDPVTGVPFQDNVIPADRIHPVAAKFLQTFVPLPPPRQSRCPLAQHYRQALAIWQSVRFQGK